MRSLLPVGLGSLLLTGCGLILDLDPEDPPADAGLADAALDGNVPPNDAAIDAADRGPDGPADGGDAGVDMEPFCPEPTLVGPLRLEGEIDEVGLCDEDGVVSAVFEAAEWSGTDLINVDEDADGETDEGCYMGAEDTRFLCGVGECATRMNDCSTICEARRPTREVGEDGLDNDCDGAIDEAGIVPDPYARPISECPAYDWELFGFFSSLEKVVPVSCVQLTVAQYACQEPSFRPVPFRDLDVIEATDGRVEEIRSAGTNNTGQECLPFRITVEDSIPIDRRLTLTDLDIRGLPEGEGPVFTVVAGGELRLRDVVVNATGPRGVVRVERGGTLIVEKSQLIANGRIPTVEVEDGVARFYNNCSGGEDGVCGDAGPNGILNFGSAEALFVRGGSDVEIQSSRLRTLHSAANMATVRVEGAERFEVVRSSIVRQGGTESSPIEGDSSGLEITACGADGALLYDTRVFVAGAIGGDAKAVKATSCALTIEAPVRDTAAFTPEITGLLLGRADTATGVECTVGDCRIWNARIAGARGETPETRATVATSATGVRCRDGCDQIAGARIVGSHRGTAGADARFVGLAVEAGVVRVGRTLMTGGAEGESFGLRQNGGVVHVHDSFAIGLRAGARSGRGWGVHNLGGELYARHNAFIGYASLGAGLPERCVGASVQVADSAFLSNILVAGGCEVREGFIARDEALFMITNFTLIDERYTFGPAMSADIAPRHYEPFVGDAADATPAPNSEAFGVRIPGVVGGATSFDWTRTLRRGMRPPSIGPVQVN